MHFPDHFMRRGWGHKSSPEPRRQLHCRRIDSLLALCTPTVAAAYRLPPLGEPIRADALRGGFNQIAGKGNIKSRAWHDLLEPPRVVVAVIAESPAWMTAAEAQCAGTAANDPYVRVIPALDHEQCHEIDAVGVPTIQGKPVAPSLRD